MSIPIKLPFSVLPDLYDALRGAARPDPPQGTDPLIIVETAEGTYELPMSSADQLLTDLTKLDVSDGQADGHLSRDAMTNALLSTSKSEEYLSVFVDDYPRAPVAQLEQRFRSVATFSSALQRKPTLSELPAAADTAFRAGWRSEQIGQWVDKAVTLYAGPIIFDILPAEERRGVAASNSTLYNPIACGAYGVSGPQFLNIPVNAITGRLSPREIAATLRHEAHHAEFTRSSPDIINLGTADAPCYTISDSKRTAAVLRLFIHHHTTALQSLTAQGVPIQRMIRHPDVQRWLEESMAEGAVARAGLVNIGMFSKQVSTFLRDEVSTSDPQRIDIVYAAYLVAIGDALGGESALAERTLLTTKMEDVLAGIPTLLQSWKNLIALMRLGTSTITER